MGPKATAVLKYVSQCIYNVRQSCITAAVAAQTVQVDSAQAVDISGLDMTNQATTRVGECTQTSQADMQSIYGAMDALQTRVQVAAAGMEGVRSQFIASLKSAVSVSVVNQCVALATSTTSVLVQHASGTVTFDNVRLVNVATAAIQKCVQSVQVSVGGHTMPLEAYVEQNEAWMGAVAGADAASDSRPGGGGTTTSAGTAAAKAVKVFPPCSMYQRERDTAWFVTAVIGALGLTASFVL